MKTVGDKKYQPTSYAPPKTYDGMGAKPPHPQLYTPEPTLGKDGGEVRGKGAAKKGAYLSKNG